MWRYSALAAVILVLQLLFALTGARAQGGGIDCNSFEKNPDGSWTVIKKVFIPVQNVRVVEGTVFRPGQTFLGDDMTERLSKACPDKQVAAPESATDTQTSQAPQPPRVSLSQFADANGFIDVKRLTCAELNDTSSDEAQFFLAWYSGWYHGLEKKPGINLARMRYIINNVATYCKAYPDKKLAEVLELWLR